MYSDRIELYKQLEDKLDSKILVYITSDRPGFETQIGQDAIDFFINQFDLRTVRITDSNSTLRR